MHIRKRGVPASGKARARASRRFGGVRDGVSLRAAAIDHAKQGGLRIDIKHKYYVPLLANLLVIYIIRIKTRPRRAPYIVFFHFTHSKNGPDKLQLKLFLEP